MSSCSRTTHESWKRDPALFARMTIIIAVDEAGTWSNCRFCRSTFLTATPDEQQQSEAA